MINTKTKTPITAEWLESVGLAYAEGFGDISIKHWPDGDESVVTINHSRLLRHMTQERLFTASCIGSRCRKDRKARSVDNED